MRQLLLFAVILLFSSCSFLKKPVQEQSFPVYGNYCGPLHPKKGSSPMPINITDLACKNHDNCYEKNGYFNSECDQKLIKELGRVNATSPEEEIFRQLIIKYFKNSQKYN